jgi:YfiH family protein
MGVGIDDCAITNQVHKNDIRIVDMNDKHVCMSKVPYEVDGIVTKERGLPIICMVADCVPVLLWDGVHGVIAAVHCGWRSSVTDILKNAIDAMCSLGAVPADIHAALGPALGRCCFESDDDVPDAIEVYLGGDTEGLFDRRADGKTMVDLRAANARRLLQLGLAVENIDISEECTYCSHDKYWSHRYTKGNRGSQAAIIVLD